MPTFEHPESASIITRTVTGQDSDGNDVYGTASTATTGVYAPSSGVAGVAGSAEAMQGQEMVVTQPTFYLSDGAPVPTATDRLQVRGLLYEIDGEAAVYHNPFTGYEPGPVLRLTRVTG